MTAFLYHELFQEYICKQWLTWFAIYIQDKRKEVHKFNAISRAKNNHSHNINCSLCCHN